MKYGASRVQAGFVHAKPSPVEHFQIKWGQAYTVANLPPYFSRVNLSAKNKWGQNPIVPIYFVGPGSKLQQRFSNNDDITSGEEIVPQPNETRPCLTLDLKHLPSESTHFYLGPSFKPGL